MTSSDQGHDAPPVNDVILTETPPKTVYGILGVIATAQVSKGDLVAVDFDKAAERMVFECVDEGLPIYTMYRAAGVEMPEDYEMIQAAASLQSLSSRTALSSIRD